MKISLAAIAITFEVAPSFEDKYTIDVAKVYHDNGDKWVVSAHLEPFGRSTESEQWERDLLPGEVKKLQNLLSKLTTSCVPEYGNPFGLDGTTYHLDIICGRNCLSFDWWGELPSGWHTLKPLFRLLYEIASKDTSAKWWQFWQRRF